MEPCDNIVMELFDVNRLCSVTVIGRAMLPN